MKVLVTGCAGFIASSLCDKLLKEDHEVYGFDNFEVEDLYVKTNKYKLAGKQCRIDDLIEKVVFSHRVLVCL